jgi:cellulose synthase/poly-beta-1,6-N-acetylglucosamine synthase-like glycosyltransferase
MCRRKPAWAPDCLARFICCPGLQNSKNPGDNAVAASFSIYFWIIDRFYNASREALGLSSFVTGTGFMVTLPFLEKIGGWNTRTITEDYEFSAQCVLAGERVHYVSDAIVYDEQPLTFTQSWKQRRRWSTGNFDSSRYYLKDLCKEAVRRRSALCLDLAMTYLSPVIFVLSLLGLAGQNLLGKHGVTHFAFPGQPILWGLALCLLLAALFTYKQNRRTLRGFCFAAGSFLFLLASWIPINLITLLRKQRKWEMIPPTRSISLEEM